MGYAPKPGKQHRTKVIVRKLPPSLTESDFQTAVDRVVPGLYTWLKYVQGKVSTKKLTYSRAYIAFKEPLGVITFKETFDGHTFVNDRGMVFKCAVEFAPWQKVPPQRVKRDPRENTLDQDADFLAFTELYEKGPEALAAVLKAAVASSKTSIAGAAAGKPAEGLDGGPQGTAISTHEEPSEKEGRRSRKAKPVSTEDGLDAPATQVAAGKKPRDKDKPKERDKAKEMASGPSAEASLTSTGGRPTQGKAQAVAVPVVLRAPKHLCGNSNGTSKEISTSTDAPEVESRRGRESRAVRESVQIYRPPLRSNRLFQETLKAATGAQPQEGLPPPAPAKSGPPDQGSSGKPGPTRTRAPYDVGGKAGKSRTDVPPKSEASTRQLSNKVPTTRAGAPGRRERKEEQPG